MDRNGRKVLKDSVVAAKLTFLAASSDTSCYIRHYHGDFARVRLHSNTWHKTLSLWNKNPSVFNETLQNDKRVKVSIFLFGLSSNIYEKWVFQWRQWFMSKSWQLILRDIIASKVQLLRGVTLTTPQPSSAANPSWPSVTHLNLSKKVQQTKRNTTRPAILRTWRDGCPEGTQWFQRCWDAGQDASYYGTMYLTGTWIASRQSKCNLRVNNCLSFSWCNCLTLVCLSCELGISWPSAICIFQHELMS